MSLPAAAARRRSPLAPSRSRRRQAYASACIAGASPSGENLPANQRPQLILFNRRAMDKHDGKEDRGKGFGHPRGLSDPRSSPPSSKEAMPASVLSPSSTSPLEPPQPHLVPVRVTDASSAVAAAPLSSLFDLGKHAARHLRAGEAEVGGLRGMDPAERETRMTARVASS